MHQSTLCRAFARLRRNARLVLPGLALALTLAAVVCPPPADDNPAPVGNPIVIPQVNWNS